MAVGVLGAWLCAAHLWEAAMKAWVALVAVLVVGFVAVVVVYVVKFW